jgi:peptidoglycan/LPS O-acetylase OafA/YrhL
LTATLVGYAGVVFLHGTPYNDFPIHFVGLFAIGIAGAILLFSCRSDWQALCQSPVVTWICVACVFIVLGFSYTHYLRGLFYIDVFVALITVTALMRTSTDRWRPLRRALESRPVAFVGSFSYSLYLIHAPLIQCVWQYMVHPLGFSRNTEFFLLFLSGTPLILACSYLFYLAFERPFLPSRSRTPTRARPSPASMPPCALLIGPGASSCRTEEKVAIAQTLPAVDIAASGPVFGQLYDAPGVPASYSTQSLDFD